jgi:tungstate transport system ATP-binding protein
LRPPAKVLTDTDATPSEQTLVSLQDAHVHFGSTPALRGVTLSLNRGDRLMLVGANGSGKTTLLRVLHGLLSPDAPTSRQTRPMRPEGRPAQAAMVFQRPFLLNLSVQFNVALGLWLRRVPGPERARRCQAALQRVGLASLAGQRARALSGGQQQRLALARAWALQPDILFLDEPTASLDPSAKREVEALVQDFADQGVTLVMSTHNLGQAKRLGTRVAYLEAGELVVERPVNDFFSSPDLPERARQFLKGELPWHT